MGRNLQGYACARSPNQEYASFKKGNISNLNSYRQEIFDLHGNTHLFQFLSILMMI